MVGAIRRIVAWFNREDWDELKTLCPPDDLQGTYDEWHRSVERGLKLMGVTENDIEKVILTPDDLRDWKAAHGGEIDSRARARMAVEIAASRKDTRH